MGFEATLVLSGLHEMYVGASAQPSSDSVNNVMYLKRTDVEGEGSKGHSKGSRNAPVLQTAQQVHPVLQESALVPAQRATILQMSAWG